MNLQLQPNRWSCLPTACAMALKMPTAELITRIGHDGSQIVFPGLLFPRCHRGFHIQEIAYTLLGSGWHTVVFEMHPIITESVEPILAQLDYLINNHGSHGSMKDIFDQLKVRITPVDGRYMISALMEYCSGVFLGGGHAVAWNANDSLVYDPNGKKYPISDLKFEIDRFVIFCGR